MAQKTVLLTSLSLAGLALPASASAAARPTLYDNFRGGGVHAGFNVARDGRSLNFFHVIPQRGRCGDGGGGSITNGFSSTGEKRVKVAADGTFSFVSPRERGPYVRRGRRVDTGTYRLRLTGKVAPDRVTGTFSITFVGRRLHCSTGTVSYVAYRDGTKGAPFRDSRAATGLYVATGRGLASPFSLRAYVPSQDVTRVTVRTRAKCHNGTLTTRFTVVAFAYKGGRFSNVITFPPTRASKTERTRNRLAFSGTFFRSGGVYRIRGALHMTGVITVGGRHTDTCTLNTRFSGRLKS